MRHLSLILLTSLTLSGCYLFTAGPPPAPEPTPSPTPTPPLSDSQVAVDPRGFVALPVSSTWQVTQLQAEGLRLSGLSTQSPDYQGPTTLQATPVSDLAVTQGALLEIIVTRQLPGAQSPLPEPTRQDTLHLGDNTYSINVYEENLTTTGRLFILQLPSADKLITFYFAYDPGSVARGERVFQEFLDNLSLTTPPASEN